MRNFMRLVFKFTLILFIIVGIVIGAVIVYAKIYGKEIDIANGVFADNRDPVTVLIAGLHPDGPLTDFIMVAKYNPKTGKINALSIPRDTKVVGTIDGKINSAYAKGKNIEKLKDKVKEVTSLKVDYYVILDTATVRKMVDAIGGIPMDVPINMYYDDEEQGLHINLKKGYQVLDGKKAEQFVRFRKNNDGTGYLLGDVDRVKAQHAFIKAAIDQVLKPSTLLKLPDLISLGFQTVKTDMKLTEILSYVDDVKKFDKENLRIESLPGGGDYIDNISYFIHDPVATKKLVEEMFIKEISLSDENEENGTKENSTKVTKSKSEVTIEVLNATSRNGLASSVAEKLKEEGYNVTKIGNYKTTSNMATTVISRTDDTEYAKKVKSFLGIGTVKTEKEESSKVDITVILGSDYK